MSFKTRLAMAMPKNQLMKTVQKKLSRDSKFHVTNANVFIDYVKNEFTLRIIGAEETLSRKAEVTEYSDMNEILIAKINEKIKAKKMNMVDVRIDFENHITEADVYYIDENNERLTFTIESLF